MIPTANAPASRAEKSIVLGLFLAVLLLVIILRCTSYFVIRSIDGSAGQGGQEEISNLYILRPLELYYFIK